MGAGWWCKADRALRRRKVVDLKELEMGGRYIKRGNKMERGETYLDGYVHISVSSPLYFQSDRAALCPSHAKTFGKDLLDQFLGEVLVARR